MKAENINNHEFRRMIRHLARDERVRRMKEYSQHGSVSTYGHCLRVAWLSYRISRRFRIKTDDEAMLRAALLHDYFLYDWHEPGHAAHATQHAGRAADNARRDFDISEEEYEIIRTHMWPVSPAAVPASREAAIVCAADKLCTIEETLFMR